MSHLQRAAEQRGDQSQRATEDLGLSFREPVGRIGSSFLPGASDHGTRHTLNSAKTTREQAVTVSCIGGAVELARGGPEVNSARI